jgi:hypothetical protein
MYQIIVEIPRDKSHRLADQLPGHLPAGSWIWWWKQNPLPHHLIIFLTNREVARKLETIYNFLHEFGERFWIRRVRSQNETSSPTLKPLNSKTLKEIVLEAAFLPVEEIVHFELCPYPDCWEGGPIGPHQLSVTVQGYLGGQKVDVALLRRGDAWSIQVPMKSHKPTVVWTIDMAWNTLEPMVQAVKSGRRERFQALASYPDGQPQKRWEVTIRGKQGSSFILMGLSPRKRSTKGATVVFGTSLLNALRLLRHDVGQYIP